MRCRWPGHNRPCMVSGDRLPSQSSAVGLRNSYHSRSSTMNTVRYRVKFVLWDERRCRRNQCRNAAAVWGSSTHGDNGVLGNLWKESHCHCLPAGPLMYDIATWRLLHYLIASAAAMVYEESRKTSRQRTQTSRDFDVYPTYFTVVPRSTADVRLLVAALVSPALATGVKECRFWKGFLPSVDVRTRIERRCRLLLWRRRRTSPASVRRRQLVQEDRCCCLVCWTELMIRSMLTQWTRL